MKRRIWSSTVAHFIERASIVPRHTEINEFLTRKICKDLEIPEA